MPDDDREAREAKEAKAEANTLLAGGVGIGVIGAAMAAVGGAVCPVCVVAAPALLGVGAWKRWRASQRERSNDEAPPVQERRTP